MESQSEVDDRWSDDKVQPSLNINAEDHIQQEMETATPNKNFYAKTLATSPELSSPFSPSRCIDVTYIAFSYVIHLFA